MQEDSCDIGIVIALEEEFQQILPNVEITSEFDPEKEEYFHRFTVGLGSRAYNCVAVLIGGMGPEKAALSSERLISRYCPSTLVNIGIAGTVSKSVNVCDVVVGSQIDGYHQDGKVSTNEAGERTFHTSGEVLQTSKLYQKHALNFGLAHKKEMEEWKSSSNARAEEILTPPDQAFLAQNGITVERPSLHVGHVASGPLVVSSAEFSNWLLNRDRKYLAVEMEAYGVMQSAFDTVESNLVIRGISDFCDDRKSLLDGVGGGAIRSTAMQNAFGFFTALADSCLLKYSDNSSKRPQWRLVLDATFRDKKQVQRVIDELAKVNFDDISIQIKSAESGSIIIHATSTPAASARIQSLIGLGVLRKINDYPIKSFTTDAKYDIADTIRECEELLEDNETSEDKGSIESLSEMAISQFDNSRFETARVLFEKLLFLQQGQSERNLDHIDSICNLAHTYRRLGDLAEAKRLLDEAIKHYDQHDHLNEYIESAYVARSNRAEIMIALGRPYEAGLEAKEVLNKQVQRIGRQHKDTLKTQNNLAEAYRLTGNLEIALQLHYENLTMRLKISDERSSDVTISIWNLFLCYDQLGMVDQASELLHRLDWLETESIFRLTIEQQNIKALIESYTSNRGYI